MQLITIILSGGTGTRLWPASKNSYPKQYLSFKGKYSFLQNAIFRALSVNSNAIIVVTAENQIGLVTKQLEPLNSKINNTSCYIIGEPEAKNTTPAIILGTKLVKEIVTPPDQDTDILILSSDHEIQSESAFASDVRKGRELTKSGWIVTFGISPTRPETGYGYLETGNPLKTGFKLKSFREKPTFKKAQEFYKSGNFLWNAGIFLFSLNTIEKELVRHVPKIVNVFSKVNLPAKNQLSQKMNIIYPDSVISALYKNLESISIDYAVMEKVEQIATIKSQFDWSDVGSWDEVQRVYSSDKPAAEVESDSNTIYSDLPVTLVGVNELIIVIKNGSVLVTRKEKTQLVRDAVEKMKTEHPELL